jgi:hypothetical protein
MSDSRPAPGIVHLGATWRRNLVAQCDHRIRTRDRVTTEPGKVTCLRCKSWGRSAAEAKRLRESPPAVETPDGSLTPF